MVRGARYNLRWLFLLLLACSIFLAIARTAGYAVAGGSTVSLLAICWAALWPRRNRVMWLRGAAALSGLTALWFLAIDWSWHMADCRDCGYCQDIGEYRIFAVPICATTYESHSDIERAMADLGVPCMHKGMERWHKHRLWGLLICGYPCLNGISRLSGGDLYEEEIAEKLRQRAKEDPKFAAAFHDRVIERHDYAYFWKTIDELPAGEKGEP